MKKKYTKIFKEFLLCFLTINVESALLGETGFEQPEQLASIRNLVAIGEYGEAEALGSALLKNCEQEGTDLFALMGAVVSKQGKRRQAARYYIEASEVAKDHAEHCRFFILAGDAYYRNKDYTLAEMLYKDSYDRSNNEETLFRYGCSLLKKGKINEAEALHFTSEGIRERFEWNCATYWYERGELEKTLAYLMRWIKAGTFKLKYYKIAGQILYRLGRLNEALEITKLGEEICNEKEKNDKSHLELLKRRIQLHLHKNKRENLPTKDGLEQHTAIWECLGYLDAGEEKLFGEVLQKLRKQFPEEVQFIEGVAFERQGCYEKAYETFQELAEENDSSDRVCYLAKYRAMLLSLRLGRQEEAGEQLQELQNELTKQNWMKNPQAVVDYLERLWQRYRGMQKKLF